MLSLAPDRITNVIAGPVLAIGGRSGMRLCDAQSPVLFVTGMPRGAQTSNHLYETEDEASLTCNVATHSP